MALDCSIAFSTDRSWISVFLVAEKRIDDLERENKELKRQLAELQGGSTSALASSFGEEVVRSIRKDVTIFGASGVQRSDESGRWEQAFQVGKAIAQRGFKVVNGGYTGTMEASAEGARTVESGEAEGILVSSLFPARANGNDFLTSRVETESLTARIDVLWKSQ